MNQFDVKIRKWWWKEQRKGYTHKFFFDINLENKTKQKTLIKWCFQTCVCFITSSSSSSITTHFKSNQIKYSQFNVLDWCLSAFVFCFFFFKSMEADKWQLFHLIFPKIYSQNVMDAGQKWWQNYYYYYVQQVVVEKTMKIAIITIIVVYQSTKNNDYYSNEIIWLLFLLFRTNVNSIHH